MDIFSGIDVFNDVEKGNVVKKVSILNNEDMHIIVFSRIFTILALFF